MRKVGLIINIHAKKARRNPKLIHKVIAAFPDQESVWQPVNLEELSKITKHILNEKYEVIFLSGGDGTFRATVESFLLQKSAQSLPYFVLLQGGTGGLYSKYYYGSRNPLEHLQTTIEKLENAEALTTTPINILEVNGRYGFIFAVGGFSNMLSYYMGHQERSIALANWIIFRNTISCLLGTTFYRQLFSKFQAKLKNQDDTKDIQVTTICCSTLPVGYILNPFYGMKTNESFSGLVFYQSPFRIFRHLFSILKKEPFQSSDIEQFTSNSIDIFLSHPLQHMLDGDMLEPAKEIRVRLGPQINLLTL